MKAITGRTAELLEIKWDARPFSRIVSWGREFKRMLRFIGMNSTEMAGFTREKSRSMFLQIQEALAKGLLPRTPGLIAAGFT